MEAADLGNSDDSAFIGRTDRPCLRRVLVEGEVRSGVGANRYEVFSRYR
jgi:hypothetical protein